MTTSAGPEGNTIPLVPPHGRHRALYPRLVDDDRAELLREEARDLPALTLSTREASDLTLLGMGAYTPLEGFMTGAEYSAVTRQLHRPDGLFWPIPIVLAATTADARAAAARGRARLLHPDGTLAAVMTVVETFVPDRSMECRHVFGTEDPKHPGVQSVLTAPPVYVGGPVEVIDLGSLFQRYRALCLTPAEARAAFQERGWRRVAAFQTRNPMHRSHEHLAKLALEWCDGVFIHQVLGRLKPGDLPAEVRVEAIDALVTHYFPPGRVLQAGYPIEMRYAGPREALLHAVIRQNYGAAYLVVGRDHAGVGSYYGPYDAQHIFTTLAPDDLVIKPLTFGEAFYCTRCEGMMSSRTCPHPPKMHVSVSGTQLRALLADGATPPEHFTRPEVWEVLARKR
ncbi:MAG: sulfate adenylyltransferase [Clostridia bacterium]